MSMASRCGYGRVSRQWILDPSVTPTSVMHMRGVPIAVISQRLGRADLACTMRTYVHAQDGALRAAATVRR
jgi:integrase